MIAGTIYGVVLNDAEELDALASEFAQKPYRASPAAPVVYMRPRTCVTRADVMIAPGQIVQASATVALLFDRDAAAVSVGAAMSHVAAACLALDLTATGANYYRPAIAQRNADGFLPLADFAAPALPAEIRTLIDGELAHHWMLDRLVRSPAELIAELSRFMTFRAGDLLMLGLPGDPPTVRGGQHVRVEGGDLPDLTTALRELAA